MTLTIENSVISFLILIILIVLYVKFWRFIANYVGERLGIGKFIMKLLGKLSSNKIR